jgi:hypothetical protein
MKGDFTRSTFDPTKGYSSVRMQQGRVQLDADWNEQVEIGDRLREQGLSDVIGRCGAPKDENGGGFRVEVAAGGADLAVTPGRIWVDGILCENRSTPGSLRLTQQRDFPGYQSPAADGLYLIYLDVWQQHVTALEDGEIRETALGGPDTATRTRTVAQVKWVQVGAGAECDDDLAAYTAATAAPTGRLRARTRPGGDPGPCAVPEAAGYTRLENLLYRVEVHQGGAIGGGPQPSFKWSRENGSVVTRWLSTSGQEVTVESLGRDRLLGFEDTRWVELTDDRDELNGVAGQLLEVTAVGDDTLTLSAAPGNPGPAGRHPKVRRWEMTGAGGAVPAVQAPDDGDNSWTPLESGIQIDFAAGTYRTGDWWWIPARAFIGEFAGDIEWPSDAAGPLALAPEGVTHHYCRLALVDRAGGLWVDPPTDCRPTFCPLTDLDPGCCNVVVEPGVDRIQAAIDSLPPQGGCVCLKAGIHEITQTIVLGRGNVSLNGESLGTVVRSTQALPLLQTGSPGPYLEGIQVAGIEFQLEVPAGSGGGLPLLPLVDLESSDGTTFTDCGVTVSEPATVVGVRIGRGIDLRIEGCRLEGTWIGVWLDTDSRGVAIRRCQLEIGSQDGRDLGYAGILIDDAYGSCFVEDNLITGYVLGVRIDGATPGAPPLQKGAGSLVSGNRITRSGELDDQGFKLFAIDLAGKQCTVRDNRIACPSPHHGGIRVTGAGSQVEGNRLWGPQESLDASVYALGILVGYEDDPAGGYGDGAVVAGNVLDGTFDGIWVHGAEGVDVRANRLANHGEPGRVGVGVTMAELTRVEGNRVESFQWGLGAFEGRSNRFEGNEMRDGFAGIVANTERALSVAGNRVENLEGPGLWASALVGQAAMRGNRFTSCGYAPGSLASTTVWVDCLDLAGELRLEDCEIVDTGVSLDGKDAVAQPAWGAFLLGTSCAVRGNRIAYNNIQRLGLAQDHRALVLVGPFAYREFSLGTAQVEGNWFMGPAPVMLVSVVQVPLLQDVLLLRFDRATFSDNVCQHLGVGDGGPAGGPAGGQPSRTVLLAATRSTVQGNQVASIPPVPSFDFDNTGRTVFLGNFTQGPVINWTPFPVHFNTLNQFG